MSGVTFGGNGVPFRRQTFVAAGGDGVGPDGKKKQDEGHKVAHDAKTTVDVAHLATESPKLAAEVMDFIAKNPRLDASILKALVDLAQKAPDAAESLMKVAEKHPRLARPLVKALPKLAHVYDGVYANLKKQYPQLSDKVLARISEDSLKRGIMKAVPVLGIGIASWGTVDTIKAALDPRVSDKTKGLFAAANTADWGSAISGLFCETGIGEAASVATAVASIGLYAKAEASKEVDLHHAEAAHADPAAATVIDQGVAELSEEAHSGPGTVVPGAPDVADLLGI
jgi:hypothetical protein